MSKGFVKFGLAIGISLCLITSAAGCSSGTGQPDGNSKDGWKLVFSDDFDGDNGSEIDKTKWVQEVGNNNGWGNSELQYYTDGTNNCYQQNGSLIIKAVKENKEGYTYTSARLKTKGKFDNKYGRIEMRAKLPQGQGIWPAFWMLGSDIDQVNWPDCGEIDIMEYIGRNPDTVYGTVHGPEYYGGNGLQRFIKTTGDLHNDFHTYALEWDDKALTWFFDDQEYFQLSKEKFPANKTWIFDKEYFILMNLAVGGQWPGYPDDTTVFPQTYEIDSVKVYQKAE